MVISKMKINVMGTEKKNVGNPRMNPREKKVNSRKKKAGAMERGENRLNLAGVIAAIMVLVLGLSATMPASASEFPQGGSDEPLAPVPIEFEIPVEQGIDEDGGGAAQPPEDEDTGWLEGEDGQGLLQDEDDQAGQVQTAAGDETSGQGSGDGQGTAYAGGKKGDKGQTGKVRSASEALRGKKSSGMVLSGRMSREKSEMSKRGVRAAVSRLKADSDYVNHEVVYLTDDEAEAGKAAAAYNGIVESYSDGVAVIRLAADTLDALEKAEDLGNDFPPVYPNYIYSTDEAGYSSEVIEKAKARLGANPAGGNADGNGTANPEDVSADSNGQTNPEDSSADGNGQANPEDVSANGNAPAGPEGGNYNEQGQEGQEGQENGYINSRENDKTPIGTGKGDEYTENTDPGDVETVFDRGRVSEADIAAYDAIKAADIVDEDGLAGPDDEVGADGNAPNDEYAPLQWYQGKIGTYEAWNRSKGKDIKVAVIDSGIWESHPDLKNNIAGVYSTCGHAFNKGTDNMGHGTHVAGIIAAQADNRIGIAGVAPQAKIVSIKAIDLTWDMSSGKKKLECLGRSSDVSRAVNLAVEKGCKVINMSLGQSGNDPVMEKAVTAALNDGVVVVASAGNNTYDLNVANAYPAKYPGVICVSASNMYGALTYYSNYGSGIITIAAPGGDGSGSMVSTYKADSYTYMHGTSMAAPVVSGVAALLLAQNTVYKDSGNIDAVKYITGILTASANNAPPYTSVSKYGAGLVNADAATKAIANIVVTPPVFSCNGGVLKDGSTLVSENAEGLCEVKITGGGADASYFYTTNGKAPGTGSTRGGTITVNTNGKTSITLKAMACFDGKLSKVTTVNLKLDARIASISLSPKTGQVSGSGEDAAFSVGKGKKMPIVPAFSPTKPADKALKWASSNTSVAKVDNKGVVTAINAGSAKITARNERSGAVGAVTVMVQPAVTSLKADPASMTMSTQEGYIYKGVPAPVSINMSVSVSPAAASTAISYQSSNTKVARVDQSGTITAVGAGKAKITALAADGSGKKAACNVTVIKPARIAKITCKEGQPDRTPPETVGFAVAKGKSIGLKAVLADKKATMTGVVWASENKSVATVKAGKVTGVTTGETFITAKTADGNDEARIKITVKPATAELGASAEAATLKINIANQDSCPWKVINKTGGAHAGQYVYTVKNKKIASVTDNGSGSVKITALAKGSTTVTAKATDGTGKTVKITITVKKMVTSIVLSPASTGGIAYGKSMKFKATVLPEDASNKKLVWRVDNPGFFKVDDNGKVTVLKKAYYSDEFTRVYVSPADGNASAGKYFDNTTGTTNYARATKVFVYNDPLTGVKFGKFDDPGKTYTSITLDEGKNTTEIMPYVMYDGADAYKTLDFSSSNDRIAEFREENGVLQLKANAPGTATITLKALDGSGKTAKLKVTVNPRGGGIGK